jgi:hypothetical protein
MKFCIAGILLVMIAAELRCIGLLVYAAAV